MTQKERAIYLIQELQRELPEFARYNIPEEEEEQWMMFRGLCNVRPPFPASEEFLKIQDAYLQERVREKGVTDCRALKPAPLDERLFLWKGDITTLQCDAIVNAANSQMLGCFQMGHSCIDNMIHSMAGVQLRAKCNEIMQAQGHEEETGRAKITPGYNLPAKYVLHTVGPIILGSLRQRDRDLLASSYRSCLELAAENGCESVAFCCISTGVFRFPAQEAARIAVNTVKAYLEKDNSVRQVIFNVFKDSDRILYDQLLRYC